MRALSVGTTCALVAAWPSIAGVVLVEPREGQWIARDQAVVLRIDEPEPLPSGSEGRLAIFIGPNDVTDLCNPEPSGELRCSSAMLPLPEGEQQVSVYRVKSSTDWQEIGRLPLRVLTRSGLEVSEVTPRLGVTQSADVGHGGSVEIDSPDAADPAQATSPPDDDLNTVTAQGGIATRSRRSGWELRSAWNVVAAFGDARPLRYGSQGDEAPAVDLSDYLIELRHEGTQLALGHVSYGDQPLLISGLSHRGLVYRQTIGGRFDVGVTAQSGQLVTGYSNMLGVQSDNYIAGVSAGFEFLRNRPGGLRLSVMSLKAETRSDLDFNTGHVPDAESNSGYGARLLGSTPGGRLRGSFEFASSRYTNPNDPLLSQGLSTVPVREETSRAFDLDVAVDLLQECQLGATTYATVTLEVRHLHTDPLYRSVGAWVIGDQESNTGLLSASIGLVSFQAMYFDSDDNVDDVPTILKTNTRYTTVSYALPLKSLFEPSEGGDRGRGWLPDSLSQTYWRMHQKGVNQPPGFDPSTHIPDQVTELVTTILSWSFWRATVDYELTLSDLDNRQPARARADFHNITHGIALGLEVSPTLRFGLGLNADSTDNREQDLRQDTGSYNFDFDWQMRPSLGLRGSYSLIRGDDTQGLSDSRNWTTHTEIDYRLLSRVLRRRTFSAQLYLRHEAFAGDLTDRTFGLSTHASSWSVSGGLNLGYF